MQPLNQVVIDDQAKEAAMKAPISSPSSESLAQRAPLADKDPATKEEEEAEDSDEDEQGNEQNSKDEMEAVQEARQLQQLRTGWKWFMRSLTVICIAGTIFLTIDPGRVGIRIAGAAPWRWTAMLSIFLGSKSLFNWFLDLVMVALDRKHVVAKRLSFILGGIFDNLVFTLYCITLRIAWDVLLRDAAVGDGGWGPAHLLIRRICSSLIAWGVIHTVSKGIARYMEVYFQREAFFNSIMKALAEEFVVVTLLSLCSMDMRLWQVAHGEVQGATPATSQSTRQKETKQNKKWTTTETIKQMPGLHTAFEHIKQMKNVIKEGPLSLTSFLRLTKDTLPIKTDMIILKEGAVQRTDLSLARLHKVGSPQHSSTGVSTAVPYPCWLEL